MTYQNLLEAGDVAFNGLMRKDRAPVLSAVLLRWKMKREFLSPSDTTNWDQLPEVK